MVSAALVISLTGAAAGSDARCAAPVAVMRDGKAAGAACPDELTRRKLTVVDLGDEWTPYALGGAAVAAGQAPPAYRETFLKLAAEEFAAGTIAEEDAALELFGVPPNFHVVLARMDDDERLRCHDAVADEALAGVGVLRWEKRATGEARRAALARKRGLVAAAAARRGLASAEALAGVSAAYAKQVAEVERLAARGAVIEAIQAHLICEGLLPAKTRSRGFFDWNTAQALRAYQRRHWIVAAGELDAETRDAMRADPRELELRLALRVLRQRVADAAGLIEDGSARAAWGTVLGRTLDGPEMRYHGDYSPLANGAPDRISAATEVAAAALGWRDFASVRASLRARLAAEDPHVAVALPPAPAYHRVGVALRAEIDRGDVSYDVPRRGASRAGHAGRRPMITIYAKDGDAETALVRWPTTIGGWQDEKLANGAVARRYKASDVGPRVWRDLVVTPVWYAPKSTPDAELVRARNGKWELKDELIGPGYRSAYGLAMLIHHMVVGGKYVDRAIRTHGSVNYPSISKGDSHGCHRTYNHQILGLTSFLLRHHAYTVAGPLQETYVRKIRHKRSQYVARRTDRGFYYELTPPVPVEVLAGEVVGRRSKPVRRALYGLR